MSDQRETAIKVDERRKRMEINGKPVKGKMFAFDGCHKIYLCESDEEVQEARCVGYELHPIIELKRVFGGSCDLRFISNWALNKHYVLQFEEARFTRVGTLRTRSSAQSAHDAYPGTFCAARAWRRQH